MDHEAHRSFMNWVGCAVGAAQHETATAALAAVQALYQMEQTEQSTRSVIADFMARLPQRVDAELRAEVEADLAGYATETTPEDLRALALSLALLGKTKSESPAKSATFFTALTDFEDPGPLKSFIDEGFISGIMVEAHRKGYLDQRIMARTFSYLRPNDLVYGPAVKAYLLGEARPKFDLLFWNEDSTRLPERMAREYLTYLYRDNQFAKGEFEIDGHTVAIDDIKKAAEGLLAPAGRDVLVPLQPEVDKLLFGVDWETRGLNALALLWESPLCDDMVGPYLTNMKLITPAIPPRLRAGIDALLARING